MKKYLFFREEGFYPVDLKDDQDAIANALKNKGTIQVKNIDGKIIWRLKENENLC